MGTTIRRQPVNFDIPASPNYKFLNITNFRGLDVSSNPFEQATNTASDCLNVYVDETNTLTTRPRLEKKFDVSENDETLVDVYPLQEGYLIHHVGKLRLFRNGQKHDITGDYIPTEKCTIFEQSDKIYLLDGTKYLVIDGLTIKEVEGYVPTRYVKDVSGNKEKVDELNILSDRYKETFFWDGTSVPNYGEVTNNVKNNAIKKAEWGDDFSEYVLIGYFKDNTCLMYKTEYDSGYGGDVYHVYYATIINTYSQLIIQDTGLEFGADITLFRGVNQDYKILLYSVTDFPDNVYGFELTDSGDWASTDDINRGKFDNGVEWSVDEYGLHLKDSGKLDTSYTPTQPTKTIVKPVYFEYLSDIVSVTENDHRLWVLMLDTSTNKYELWRVAASTSEHEVLTTFAVKDNAHEPEFDTSDNTLYYHWTNEYNNDILLEYKLSTNISTTKIFYNKRLSVWFFRTNGMYYWLEDDFLWTAPVDAPSKQTNTFVNIKGKVVFNDAINKIVTINDEEPFNIYYWNNDDPTITNEILISLNDEFYEEWLSQRKQFFKSKLITRFDNNYWFANKNRYYRSRNNDPTYFPITEFNDLGNENEPITGFNVANDTTLIAYKNDKTYLIQSFHSDATGETEYAITESKNTVGNDAIGAPIVTTLTEIPLQINYDGIYGLTQMTNVAAIERIADLMSEPINQKWLDIPDNVIDNAITLNRLYWTYIILPKDTHTEIFLLDNRTNSWYYWELPIKTISAFSKDNHAEFVADDNIVYYLTTEDIINPAFDTVLVTEYYDYGKKLIPWHWQSQILYLGTMNYSKRLVNTTFIMTDTDNQDGYGLQYSFKVFRKLASSTPEKELNGELNLVRSTTKKTNISKFGFIQFKLSNITEESQGTEAEKAYQNNKLRLVGLGLKYVLLEGLIR